MGEVVRIRGPSEGPVPRRWRGEVERVLISRERLDRRVRQLARRLTRDFRGRDLVVVPLLTGTVLFLADLIRLLPLPLRLDFLGASSYGAGTEAGQLVITKELRMSVRGRTVLLVDDILDTGRTLLQMRHRLRELGARSVKTCVLLDKKARRAVSHRRGLCGLRDSGRVCRRLRFGFCRALPKPALRGGAQAGDLQGARMNTETGKVGSPGGLWTLTPLRFGVVLAAFLFATFPQVLLGTQSFFFRDYGVLGYPFIQYARESFWRGELPLWNPLSNCGAPFLAQWGTMTLYPFSLIYLLLPLPWSLSIFCFAHLVLGGVGIYRLAGRWVGHPFAAALAGTAFVFNGFTFSSLVWPNYLVALGWMPWVVLTVEAGWRQGGGRVVLAALVSGLQMLSGVPEIILLTWLVVATLFLADLWKGELSAGSLIGRMFVMVALTAGLAAAQLLPFFDLLAHSQRERGAMTTKWAMPGWGWGNLIVPLFHCFETPQGQFFQQGQHFIPSYYLGGGMVGLAVWALWRVRTARVWLLGGLTLFGLVLALGDQTVLHQWLKQTLPAAGLARFPVKFVSLAAFTIPLLAAYAVAALAGPVGTPPKEATTVPAPELVATPASVRREWVLLGLGAVTLALMAGLLWLAWKHPFQFDQWKVTFHNTLWRAGCLVALFALLLAAFAAKATAPWWRTVAGGGALAVLVFDAATHSPKQNPTLPSSVFQPGMWERAYERPPPRFGDSRLMIGWQAEQALLLSPVVDPMRNFLDKRLAEWSNLNLIDRIPKVNGSSTLQLREQMLVQSMLYALTNQAPTGLMDFLGAAWISAPSNVVEWRARPGYLPLVTAGQKPVFVEGTNALNLMAAADFEPRQVVFLPKECEAQTQIRAGAEAVILSSNISPHRIEFEVEAVGPALAVVAQSHYHPWEAEVDGQPRPLWRANYAFQAVEVPAGRHRVTLTYRDLNLRAGGAVTLSTLLGCLLFWLRRRKLAAAD